MATTATINITSSDLMPGSSLNVSANTTLTKAGVTADLDQKESGVIKLVTGTEYRLGPLATEMSGDAHDISSYLYICNNTTEDATYYVDWGINETMIGRLYAGDWMFIPWNASDDAAEIELEPQGGTNIIEYCFFNSDFILPTAAS
jgi:hypothetical protein|tara:strand:+ start:1770 stop:2207 length:438 start_codon:yes stop_codon:yes gene_type:complete